MAALLFYPLPYYNMDMSKERAYGKYARSFTAFFDSNLLNVIQQHADRLAHWRIGMLIRIADRDQRHHDLILRNVEQFGNLLCIKDAHNNAAHAVLPRRKAKGLGGHTGIEQHPVLVVAEPSRSMPLLPFTAVSTTT